MAYTTIKKPSSYFNTKLYTGNGSTQSITGVGFQPDFTWIKNRTGTNWHTLYDVIRGTTKVLNSNDTGAESTDTTGLTSFDSDGFTHGSGGNGNVNGGSFASWNWLASNTSASNTDGSISSTVSANTTSGFSIVSYTGNGSAGATVGHSLGVAPSMIIQKSRTVVDDWLIYHKSIGATYGLALNNDTAAAASTGYWNDTAPTSSLFTIGNNGKVNTNGGTHIAYCFAEKTGYSKFGSYTGNGNADGPFIYTGFKPAFVIIKNADAIKGWGMWDNKRAGYNTTAYLLQPNESSVEDTSTGYLDFYSNGFKIRDTSLFLNANGNKMIYMAFAEEPLVGDNPATAR